MSCVSLVPALPAVSQTLVDALARKHYRGEVSAVPEIWRRLVIKELQWCADHNAELSYRHRLNACKLVDWYHRNFGYTASDWLKLYPSRSEMYRRQTIAELDWASANVDVLPPRYRDSLLDIVSDCLRTFGEYHSWWSLLNW